jgi:hypothetical protein
MGQGEFEDSPLRFFFLQLMEATPRAKKMRFKTGQDFGPQDRPIAVEIIGPTSLDAVARCVIVNRDFPGLFAASDFQWRSVRYLDVHKTDEPTLR